MAQLKSTVVQGSLRVTDTTYTTDLILSGSKTARYALIAPTSAGAPTWRALTKADISDFPTNLNQFTNGPGYVTSSGVTSITIKTTSPLSGGSDTATTSTGTYTLSLGTVGVGNGGTGATSFTANSLIMSGSTTTAALTTRAITDRTSVSALTNVATWANSTNIPTVNLIAYWDGRYQTTNNASNLTYCNKGAFGNAVTYGVDDATANGALGTGTGLTTERSVYYGLVTVNNASQTRATGIYAPTSAGTANQILVSAGGTSAPTWKATANGAVYATSANGALTFGTLPVAQGGTGLTSSPSMLINLASTTAADVLSASPRPGITGTLGIGNGGTGKTTAAEAWTALGGGDSGKHADNYYALAGHTHSEYAKIKSFSASWTSQTSIAIADSWITEGAAVVATDLQTKNLPGIVTWTITNSNITFTCTVAASSSTIGEFHFLMIKP